MELLSHRKFRTFSSLKPGDPEEKVERVVDGEIIPHTASFTLDDGSRPYSFLDDPEKKEAFRSALIMAGKAYAKGEANFVKELKWDGSGYNRDVVCKACARLSKEKGYCSDFP